MWQVKKFGEDEHGHCLHKLCDVNTICSGKPHFRYAHVKWEKRWSIKSLSSGVRQPEFESHLSHICVVLGSDATSL